MRAAETPTRSYVISQSQKRDEHTLSAAQRYKATCAQNSQDKDPKPFFPKNQASW